MLQITRVGCLVDTNFYTKLLAQTLVPIGTSVLIFLCFLLAKYQNRGSEEKQRYYKDMAWGTFLALTFIVFASVSTTIFDVFNCSQIGDDPHFWLARDHSIDCHSEDHLWYRAYAMVMISIYPIGIPALYFSVLYRNRSRIRQADRDYDPMIKKFGFLWQNYEADLWWFEVFECGRR